MSKIPDNVVNKELYSKAKKKATEKYGSKTSAYKSMYIVSTYKKMGGKYSGKKQNKGVDKWNNEKWIQVIPYLESGKKIECGFGSNSKACRPLKRIDKNTPITLPELIKKHGKAPLLKIAKEKVKNMNKRVNWNTLKIS